MTLHAIDIAIILTYFLMVVVMGLWAASRRKSKDLDSYFLGGKTLPWYLLGVSNASGMFDITGTMWLVYICFVYGLKSVWLPWLWPTFNQIILMVYLSMWLRRSNVLTGAEWIRTRFGRGTGANLAHLSVVLFALVNVVGMLAYGFKGIGKFAVVMLPWSFTDATEGLFTDENLYALIITSLTVLYVVKGGMFSVVVTEVMQFVLMTLASIAVGIIAIQQVSPEMIAAVTPEGWSSLWFGSSVGLDWTGILDKVNDAIREDGNELFGIMFGLMFFKGVLASMAGPAPNYDMQRILATRSPREASLMSGMVTAVLFFPRYLMVAGLTVIALGFFMPQLAAMEKPDFEKLLPIVLNSKYIPLGLTGLLVAGLLAAFMSTFAATVNAAPAYIVNDIYKRFINPDALPRTQVRMSYVASVAVVIVGITFGFLTTRITSVMMWIVGALYGGYVAANVLKWHWWRFNGHGYFWGMMAGIISAMFIPMATEGIVGHDINPLFVFPIILLLSVAGCILGTLLTKPEDEAVLLEFYRTVRPWGFWAPIRAKVQREDPAFVPNRDFGRDAINVIVGIVWQLTLIALPIYIVLREWSWSSVILLVLLVTTAILKLNWYDKLEKPAPGPELRSEPDSEE
jgi:Na+/proline symporter